MFDAMDRVLKTDELVREIFEYLDPSDYFVEQGLDSKDAKVSRGALFSAALCCRSFSEPALDVLWRYQEHFVYLLIHLSFIVSGKQPRQISWPKLLEEHDWEMFTKYAKRVRHLYLHSICHSMIAPEYRHVLYEIMSRLPKLRMIYLEMDMPPSLVHHLSTLASLGDLCFDVDCVDWSSHEQVEFRQLQTVKMQGKVPSINSALRPLSFPHIQKLIFGIKSSASTDPSVSDNFTLIDEDLSGFFPSLRTLVITADHLPTFATIRPILTLPHLQEIQFGSQKKTDKIDLEDEGVCEMARAWPNLTKFIIHVSNFLVHRNCLLELARCCSRLQTILMSLWFDTAPATDNLSPSKARMKVVMITCSLSNDDDTLRTGIRNFITTLFPHVEGTLHTG